MWEVVFGVGANWACWLALQVGMKCWLWRWMFMANLLMLNMCTCHTTRDKCSTLVSPSLYLSLSTSISLMSRSFVNKPRIGTIICNSVLLSKLTVIKAGYGCACGKMFVFCVVKSVYKLHTFNCLYLTCIVLL